MKADEFIGRESGAVATLVRVTCPGCGDALPASYVTNTVYREGEPIRVCDQCQDKHYRRCCRCGQWHHRAEVTRDIYGYWCETCDGGRKW